MFWPIPKLRHVIHLTANKTKGTNVQETRQLQPWITKDGQGDLCQRNLQLNGTSPATFHTKCTPTKTVGTKARDQSFWRERVRC